VIFRYMNDLLIKFELERSLMNDHELVIVLHPRATSPPRGVENISEKDRPAPYTQAMFR
jgi:hypothetical protein